VKFYSPLRYPGGKSQLADPIKELIIHNRLQDCTYAEPYAGGCGIGLHLLLRGYISNLLINDIDPSVFAFWNFLIRRPEKFIARIKEVPLTVEEWLAQRETMRSSKIMDDVGFAFFYLNRTNRSGVLNAGVIGGLDQSGNYKIDARFNRSTLIERVERIKNVRSKIKVSKLDGISFLSKHKEENVFFFIDPPYVEKGGRLYLNSYHKQDHQALSEFILTEYRDRDWVMTYDNHPMIYSLYKHFSPKKYTLQHSVKNSGYGVELIFTSKTVRQPQDWGLTLAE
jgi:DNA adenine methylase|tara:strand:- start:1022 stop:1867 length:846 start_codon:yes stop_codon:yes gene_type:complete